MLRAGVVGLGAMGGGAAVCLARTERPLSVYDVNPEAVLKWDGGDKVPAIEKNCAEVARKSDVIIVLVVTAEQVWAVLNGPEGLLAAAHPGMVIVIGSTISLEELSKMREATAKAGATLVDCGVTCPPHEHTKKRIVGMVGAEPEVFYRIKEVLDDFTQKVFLMGPPGAGMLTKIVRNMMFYASWRAAHEARVLADSLGGVDFANMAEINALSEADGSGSTLWLRYWSAGTFEQEGNQTHEFLTNVMMKDLSAAAELAAQVDMTVPILKLMMDNPKEVTSAWGPKP